MTRNQQIALTVAASCAAHLAVAAGAAAVLAWQAGAPPRNDDFRRARDLGAAEEIGVRATLTNATRERGEPLHGEEIGGGSVWFGWESPGLGDVEIAVSAGDALSPPPLAAVYRGAVLGALAEVTRLGGGGDPGRGSIVAFRAEPDTTYWLAVAAREAGIDSTAQVNLRFRPERSGEELAQELVLLLPDLFTPPEEPPEPEPEAEAAEDTEPPVPDERDWVRTTHLEDTGAKPEDAAFESDRNTEAASPLPPDAEGEEGMITQDGEEFPWAALAESRLRDGEFDPAGERPTLEIAPQWEPSPPAVDAVAETDGDLVAVPEIDIPEELLAAADPRDSEPPEAEPQPGADPEPIPAAAATAPERIETAFEEVAVAEESIWTRLEENPEPLREAPTEVEEPAEVAEGDRPQDPPAPEATSPSRETVEARPPAPAPRAEPVPPSEAAPPEFRTEAVRRRSVGKLSNLGGAPSVAAEATALGRYKQQIDQVIQRSWHTARQTRGDFASFGMMKVRFWVNREGRVVNLKVVSSNANAVMVDFSIQSIRGAAIPPMPDEVYADLFDGVSSGLLEMDYDIILY